MLPARLRSAGMLAALAATLPVDLAVTGAALLRPAARRRPAPAERQLTVLISGGKMTKALQLARTFHGAGHRVVLVEMAKYRLTGHRFSRAVDVFRTVPAPDDPAYASALRAIVREEGVDVYVPVCSPVASYYDAVAGQALAGLCRVVHGTPEMIAALDDKATFAAMADEVGLPVPDSVRVTGAEQVLDLLEEPGRAARIDGGARYVLKSIAYDPVHRLDLTPLPRETAAATLAFAASKEISPERPWVLQELMPGRELCAHTTAVDGRVQAYVCCWSSAFQVNYTHVDVPAVREWVTRFVAVHGLTGQYSFDFMLDAAGEPRAIECNPRTHSAITVFRHDDEALAAAYLERGRPMLEPSPSAPSTYWLHHEAWRLLTGQRTPREAWSVLRGGVDALLDPRDPLPYLTVPHVQLVALLLTALRRGTDWVRVDVNIGKLVEVGGD